MGIFQQEISFPRFQFLSGFKQTVAARKMCFFPQAYFPKSSYFTWLKYMERQRLLHSDNEILVPIHTLINTGLVEELNWKRDLALKRSVIIRHTAMCIEV